MPIVFHQLPFTLIQIIKYYSQPQPTVTTTVANHPPPSQTTLFLTNINQKMMCKMALAPLLQTPTCSIVKFPKEKVVVVMGATGAGKSRLAIDLAAQYPAEIINSDKMKVYEGLDILTNKITKEERDGMPHHLLGVVDPETDFTAENFVLEASLALKSVVGRKKLPIISGGSNSFIEALVEDREFRSSYETCFLWVDVELSVLYQVLADRIDRKVVNGMVDEVREFYNPKADYSKGIRRAIGVQELDSYFRAIDSSYTDEKTLDMLLDSAIHEMKINTCKLARRQVEKIHQLINVKGWQINRLDATKVYKKNHSEDADGNKISIEF
ncbi:putative transferase [Helianthus annuus]|uniref:adenylate dimethylallyltransferase (ADP/ATP-dependent) n=1 Tax=Helianthus annuus TaxID=4232 RepID=A0A251VBL0_HELAN|nr:adenylate isopentenyltransferase 3, chloroplastic [Helianthus annuus]KAF5816120.1 putative transferase [Helianthus annuus]KAJ0602658.1 putative transferase [Helianthus annuus]KAJ0609505.1 putative transferase [Helianthus annuus]KAJ0769555.1 putative transferase [Helianthus annuus]KAJ0775284.1 putative transferase [Helianthus annuus]